MKAFYINTVAMLLVGIAVIRVSSSPGTAVKLCNKKLEKELKSYCHKGYKWSKMEHECCRKNCTIFYIINYCHKYSPEKMSSECMERIDELPYTIIESQGNISVILGKWLTLKGNEYRYPLNKTVNNMLFKKLRLEEKNIDKYWSTFTIKRNYGCFATLKEAIAISNQLQQDLDAERLAKLNSQHIGKDGNENGYLPISNDVTQNVLRVVESNKNISKLHPWRNGEDDSDENDTSQSHRETNALFPFLIILFFKFYFRVTFYYVIYR